MTPQFRFTFFNAALYPAGIVVNQPIGWREAKLSLTRDPVFHSLIEYFKGTFIWYGTARDVLIEVETAQGVGAKLRVLIEQYYSGWSTVFDGLIDISQIEDITNNGTFYKISAPIIRNDFWTKIINRKGIKADIGGTVDMDGNAIAAQSSITFTLQPQAIRQKFIRVEAGSDSQFDIQAVGVTSYMLIDNANFTLDEISKRYEYGSKILQNNPVDNLQFLFVPEYAGDYTFNALIAYSYSWTGVRNIDVQWFITTIIAGVRTNTQIGVTNSAAAVSTINSFGFNPILASTITLNAGDQVYIYGVVTLSAGVADLFFIPYDGINDVKTQFTVQADTIYQPTTASVFRIYEAFASILEKITGQVGCLPGGGQEILGCSGTYHLTPGTAIRGYSLTDKPFFASLDDLWQGSDPLFNLGMGYFDAGGGVQNIEILKKADFYDKTPVINFSNVPNLVRTYALEKIFRKISIGFKSWSAESGSGVDDPQTKHDYDTGFASIGKDISLISAFYAASLGIEQARRQRKEFNKDYRLDSEIMVIAYNHSDNTQPELSENFSLISNLLNPSTRYNSRITPAENMLRWLNYLNGCMQTGGSGKYFFRAGEGNIKMTSQLNGGDCDPSISKAENGDLNVTGDFMFLPRQHKCSIPMNKANYDTILANRKKAIGINSIPMFIMDMDYSIMFGKADFTLLQAL